VVAAVSVGAACGSPPERVERAALAIEAGEWRTCAVLLSGAVRCWGGRSDPFGVDEVTLDEPVVQLAAGDDWYPMCALTLGGSVWCWRGDEQPRRIELGRPAVQVDAGFDFACAVLDDGTVRCWGRDDNGQLGYGGSAGPDVPIGAPVASIASCNVHTCALLDSGAVRCWGFDAFGALGYPGIRAVGDDDTAASVGDVDLGGAAMQLAAGDLHTCALLADGAVRCWGTNAFGTLGYPAAGNIGDDETPAAAGPVDVGGPVSAIAAHGATCALLDGGDVGCWGWGDHGRLGYGNTEDIGDDETPASAGPIDLGGRAVDVAIGADHACALLDSGQIRCWGSNEYGQLGYADPADVGDDETPAAAGDVPL